jgi:hypothetical protein
MEVYFCFINLKKTINLPILNLLKSFLSLSGACLYSYLIGKLSIVSSRPTCLRKEKKKNPFLANNMRQDIF